MKVVSKLIALVPLTVLFLLSGCSGITVLDPQGPVAREQYDLIMWSILLMLIIVLVVFICFTIILIRYRERPDHKGHDPEHDGNKLLEVVWTIIPILIVIVLAVPTVKTTFDLEDPPEISKDKETLTIQVTSADWKWIFSYPEQGIETVNFVNIPEDIPVKFKLTSADSMASFWVPSLGGQKYAMAGMQTELILQADQPDTYKGRNANFNGEGFTDMTFEVHAKTQRDFEQWVEKTAQTSPELTEKRYRQILDRSTVEEMAFSSTHLDFVNHMHNPEYTLEINNDEH
jgi:cytochrome aa3-600 menaquinol oxidase subunit 2